MAYRLAATPRGAKQVAALPPRIAAVVRQRLEALATDPGASHALKRIQGVSTQPPTLRLCVGTYRVLLKVYHDDDTILVLRIGPRDTVYRGLDSLDP